jgi:hypothetical protein
MRVGVIASAWPVKSTTAAAASLLLPANLLLFRSHLNAATKLGRSHMRSKGLRTHADAA